MKPEQQIKALAELDGWMKTFWDQNNYLWGVRNSRSYSEPTPSNLYLTSYDAIIPLIQKQFNGQNFRKFDHAVIKVKNLPEWITCDSPFLMFNLTPAQLCEALLRATVKWIE